MTKRELKGLYTNTFKVEATDAVTTRPLIAAFETVWRFVDAVRRYKRIIIAPLNWRKIVMKVDGRHYTSFFRDALNSAQDEVMRDQPEDLFWVASASTEHGTGSMDASTSSSSTSADTVLSNV